MQTETLRGDWRWAEGQNYVILFCLFSFKMREFYLQIDAKKKSKGTNGKRGRKPLNLVPRKTCERINLGKK